MTTVDMTNTTEMALLLKAAFKSHGDRMQAMKDVGRAMCQFLDPEWKQVRELARKPPHTYSSDLYAHKGAAEALFKQDQDRIAQLLGLSIVDAFNLWNAWVMVKTWGMSNYSGD